MTTPLISKKTDNNVPPPIPHGFHHQIKKISGGFIFLTLVYVVTYYFLQDSGSYLRPAERFCPLNTAEDGREAGTVEPCSRPDLFAFQVSSAIMQLFMAVMGLRSWHITKSAQKAIPATPEGRIFGYIEDATVLNAGIFVYQTWDFIFSLTIPEHSTFIMLSHHAAAAIMAYFSLEYQYIHHYAVYFGGCSEISSVFLVLCDLDVYFPSTPGSAYGTLIFACQVTFTFLFLFYRVIGWWKVSYHLWSDALYVLKGGQAELFRPGKSFILYLFLTLNVLLGFLQVYWFGLIVQKIVEVLSGA
mmetsp:Transcript_17675/g.26310  ORF Transcript_17675/g.26310 Transcript_17675/m.26310 type:complete len:301 (+) Transcript_17675:48-950(+)